VSIPDLLVRRPNKAGLQISRDGQAASQLEIKKEKAQCVS